MNMLNICEFLILNELRKDSNLYGFQIKQRIDQQAVRNASLGGIYTTLHKLETKGLVESNWEDGRNSGGARRRFYRLTDIGTDTCNLTRSLLNRLLTE